MKKTLLGLAFIATQAFADITPTFTGVSADPMNPGQFTFSYVVDLSDVQSANPGDTPTDRTPGGLAVMSPFADYFTIYDFAGYTGVNTRPAGWNIRTSNVGSTPADVTPTDNPNVTNLTFYRTGASIPAGQDLGTFTANSIYSGRTAVSYTGQGTRATGDFAGTSESNVGTTTGPMVPEPGTYALLGSGLIAFAFLRRRASQK